MRANFIACVGFSLRAEGGYNDVPGDSGGPTNYGITISTLSAYLGRPATIDDVKALDELAAIGIYRPNYWDAVAGDNLSPGVDLVTFDFAINAGPGTSAKRLQGLLGVVQDGNIGPRTLAAVAKHDAAWVITTLTYSHQEYYRQLAGFPQFGDGWLARTTRCQKAALAMV